MQYLHNLNPPLIHGDIKAVCCISVCSTSMSYRVFQSNILIDDVEHARLADFGLITISETQNFSTTISHGDQGSTRWMAPELFKQGVRRSWSSDIYAFGMTILEVRTIPCLLDRGGAEQYHPGVYVSSTVLNWVCQLHQRRSSHPGC